jgi:hypothetical protein
VAPRPRHVTPSLPTSVCRLCGGPASYFMEAPDRNHGVASGPFRHDRCRRCGTFSLVGIRADLGPSHPEKYYRPLPPPDELAAAASAAAWRIELVRRYVPAGRLVEVGAGSAAREILSPRRGMEY